jgi:hypothetical protein
MTRACARFRKLNYTAAGAQHQRRVHNFDVERTASAALNAVRSSIIPPSILLRRRALRSAHVRR